MSEMNKRYWSRHARSVTPYVPGEQLADRSYIKLNTNENPYGPGPGVTKRLQTIDVAELRLYPDPTSKVLRQSIADYFGIDAGRVFAGNGSDEVLDFAFRAFFDRVEVNSKPVLSLDLTYSFYPVFAEGNGIAYEAVPVNEDFTIDVANLVREESQGIILANPNAPSAVAMKLDQLDLLLTELGQRGRFAIIDEAYIDFGGESAVALLDKHANFVVVQTFSKSRALAGLRLGFAIGRPEAIAALETMRDMVNSYTVDNLAQALGTASMEDTSWFREITQRIVRTREQFMAEAKAKGLIVLPSETNFVLLAVPQIPGIEVYNYLRERGILVRYLSHPRLRPYVRITIGKEDDMAAVLAELIKMKEAGHD